MRIREFVAGLIVGVITATASATFGADAVRLVVNGKEIAFPDAPPQIINGRTMVPARPLAEALGATVKWDAEQRTVMVSQQPTAAPLGTDWIAVKPLIDMYGGFARSTEGVLRLEMSGHYAEFSLSTAESVSRSDTGATIRARMVNDRLWLNLPDLKASGLIK